MRRYYLVPLLVLILTAASYGQATSQWLKFTTPDKSCAVLMPSEPEKQSQVDEKGGYKIPTDIWMSKASSGIYMLGITDYPVVLDPKTEFDLDRDNFLKAVNAKLAGESEITVGGVSGREFTGVSEKFTFKSRLFYINKRTYSVVAAEPTVSIDAGRVKMFLESFSFGK